MIFTGGHPHQWPGLSVWYSSCSVVAQKALNQGVVVTRVDQISQRPVLVPHLVQELFTLLLIVQELLQQDDQTQQQLFSTSIDNSTHARNTHKDQLNVKIM